MNLAVVSALSFAGAAAIFAAIGLVIRDMFTGGKSSTRLSQKVRLARLPLAKDEKPPKNVSANIDRNFDRLVAESGVSWTSAAIFLGLVACGLLAGGGFWLWLEDPVASAITFIIGMLLPLPLLFIYRSIRQRKIRGQFADALDLIARAVRAGESFDQALSLAGEKGPEPLASELRRSARHLQMGLSIPATMRALVYRVRIMEVRIFATTLAVHREAGGNLPGTLSRMAAVVRDRLAYQRQLRAATSAGRFSATMISAVGPMLFAFIFIFYPDYGNKLITTPLGQSLLTTAIVLEIIGILWVYRMLKSHY